MNNPIRILHIAAGMNSGGAEKFIMNVYRNIDRSKVQFDFLVHKNEKGDFEQEIEDLGGKIYRIPYITEVGHLKYYKALEEFFKDHCSYSIVHAHMDYMSGLVLKAADKTGIPVRIAHSHNTKGGGSILDRIYKRCIAMMICSSATHLLASSQQSARRLFGDQAGRVTVVKNGIKADDFAFNKDVRNMVRTQLGIRKDAFVVGNVGGFHAQKNHYFLIDVFSEVVKKNPDSLLLLEGEGPLRESIKEKVQGLNLNDYVKFLGSRSDIHELLQAMDIFVSPSQYEEFPLTLVQAQGSGLKCIVSDKSCEDVDIGAKLLSFIKPDESTEMWADGVLLDYERLNYVERYLKRSGCDIAYTAKDIEKYYKKCISDIGTEDIPVFNPVKTVEG
jgi:glycosyltransferase involved in cell wall biosynthesis